MNKFLLIAICATCLGAPASAVTIDWVTVGDPGNACNPQGAQGCFGSVADTYLIGKYEVTNSQYAEFLNAKAAADPLGLYDTEMGSGRGGITRSGDSGSYTYSAIPGREDMPVNWVDFYDTLRFANWLNNGQRSSDTETGAYTLLGGTPIPSNGETVMRNPGARIFLTSEDEWYKAAYYDPVSMSYFLYPAGTDMETVCATPGATTNTANCNRAVSDLTDAGSYTASASPNGTFDQGGNVWEWNESGIGGLGLRFIRGGTFLDPAFFLRADFSSFGTAANGDRATGFRVAMIPEPGTGLLLTTGLLGLACRGRRPV